MQLQLLNILHVLVAIAMVAFILVQRGPGATAGAAFGSGASGTVFGARGAGSFLSRSTWVMATLFCLISLVMAVFVSRDLSTPDTDLGVIADSPGVTESAPLDPAMGPAVGEQSSDLPPMEPGVEPGFGSDAGSGAGPASVESATASPQVEDNGAQAVDTAPPAAVDPEEDP
jgi:preprotein translocase subunit SecG